MNLTPSSSTRFRGYLPVVIDVETGGFNHNTDALLEIAAVFIDFNDDNSILPANTVRHHITPFLGSNLEPASMAINKIDPDHPLRLSIDEKEALHDIFDRVHDSLKQYQCKRAILVGHNASFDLKFINAAVKRLSLIHI